MKKTLGTNEAINLLMQDENANWSREAAETIVEFLEQQEENDGVEIEFDRVGIRCDWNEYGTAFEAASDYGWMHGMKDEDEEDGDYAARIEEEALEYLEGETIVLKYGEESTDGIVINCF
jgi:Fe-S cluster assembly iron-binding protein IscA